MKIIEANTKEILDELEAESALTIEGLAESSIPGLSELLERKCRLEVRNDL